MVTDLVQRERELFLHTYKRLPIDIDHGEGVFLFDKAGNKYLDFFSGLAVNTLGYAHPKIVKAVSSQISKFAHLSNNYITEIQLEFSEILLKYSGMSKLFLTNSGAESIEGAIKIVRKISGRDKKIFSLTDSFHGRTYGALSLTARPKYRKGFEPFLPNIDHIKFNDIDDLENKIDISAGAVFIEFIQGEGGINVITNEFADKLKVLKEKFRFLIVADEIQTGIGRTGKPFAYNHYDLAPDIIVCAKAIGGGLPLGAILVSEKLQNVFDIGNHGTTFGGNPVCCAAGKVVLEEVFNNKLMENASTLGDYFLGKLNLLKKKYPRNVLEVRGRGLMIGIEMTTGCTDIVSEMRERKILVNCTNLRVIRLLPPLIIQKENIDQFLDEFERVLSKSIPSGEEI
jgi:acetylornithine/N-succinyldiaminopimelate aminotransferase